MAKPSRRTTFRALGAISIVTLVAMGWGYWRVEGIQYDWAARKGDRSRTGIVGIGAGYVLFVLRGEERSTPSPETAQQRAGPSFVKHYPPSNLRNEIATLHGALGLRWMSTRMVNPATSAASTQPNDTITFTASGLCVHLAYPFLIAAPWPALATLRYVRERRRPKQGMCPVCGYDLRASPDRCPECGNLVAG